METFFSTAPLFWVLLAMVGTGILVSLVALLVVQLRNNAAIHHLTFPVYDYTVKEAQQRANEILAKAEELARTVIAEAEHKSVELVRERTRDSEQAMAEYQKVLAALLEAQKQSLGAYVSGAEQALAALPRALSDEVERSKHAMAAQWDALAKRTEEFQATLGADVKRAVSDELAKEMESVRGALATYRQERMNLIERDIVAILEKATALVLKRELSLKDHADLARESLEAAKREGIFTS